MSAVSTVRTVRTVSTTAEPSTGSPSNTRWLAALALLLVFVAGAGTGWGVGTRFGARGAGRGLRDGMLLDGGPIRDYGLNATQRARIDSVLRARRGQIEGFWRGPGQELRAILDSTRADVRAALTPEQRSRFDAAHAEHERRMRGRFGPPGAGLPGAGSGRPLGGPGSGPPVP